MKIALDTTKIWMLIFVTLAMLAWKAFYLMTLGNLVLVPIAVVFLIGMGYSWFYKKQSLVRFIKAWGILLIVYAIARTLLAITISMNIGGIESYIISQVNFWLYTTNLIIFVIGILILKKRRLVLKMA
ncbi:hypothetical protein [Ekhidna sp.]|uniref:hypothetical protein n=1 Tax=Ekhidna sp. TaxID=2608089 RepID=UPI003CCB9EF2